MYFRGVKMKEISIKFIETWKKYGDVKDKSVQKFLDNRIEFSYDKNTTIRDLLRYLTKKIEKYFYQFENPNIENRYEDLSLRSNFYYFYENIPTRILNLDTKIEIFIKKLEIKNTLIFEANFAILVGAGDVLPREDGIRYYMNSKENTKHNVPHVHVKYKDEEVSISILDGSVLAGSLKSNVQKEVIRKVLWNKNKLCLAWNTKTDGEKIEIDKTEFELIG